MSEVQVQLVDFDTLDGLRLWVVTDRLESARSRERKERNSTVSLRPGAEQKADRRSLSVGRGVLCGDEEPARRSARRPEVKRGE